MRTRRNHGQSMTELAISMMFLIPVMLYSLFATDFFVTRLKAQQMTAAALWDYTGRLTHDYDTLSNNSGNSVLTSKASASQSAVQTLYQQSFDAWNGATNSGGAASPLTGPAAKGTLKSLTCGPSSASVANASTPAGLPFGSVLGPFQTNGLVQCNAQVELSNSLWGKGKPSFLDSQAGAPLYDSSLTTLELCGVGTASSGTCGSKSNLVTYVDDWALSQDGSDATSAYADQSSPTNNPHFYNVANAVYLESYGGGLLGSIASAGPAAELVAVSGMMAKDGLTQQYELPIAVLPDTQYANFFVSYHGEKSGEGPSDSDDSNLTGTEGGTQTFDTWPYANAKSDPISANAYKTGFGARGTATYMGLTAAQQP
ncbi:MAG TPA: hypothetical protein VMB50_09260 [Myxococcales bacterium]|nr:hypothetical protein [Myxococcales bacterium]